MIQISGSQTEVKVFSNLKVMKTLKVVRKVPKCLHHFNEAVMFPRRSASSLTSSPYPHLGSHTLSVDCHK